MRNIFVFYLLLLIFSSSLFAQGTLKVTTDKSTYSYGDSIQVAITITNNTDTTFTLQGSSSCMIGVGFNSVKFRIVCAADDRDFRFTPGTSRKWIWYIKPSELGIPDQDSIQTIYGHCYKMSDSTKIRAPKYYGGKLSVLLHSTVPSTELQSLRDSFKVNVLYHSYNSYDSLFYEVWQVNNHSIDSIANVLSKDYRISFIEPERYLSIMEQPPYPSCTLSGSVIYNNNQSTPIKNTYITITSENVITGTDENGRFRFYNLIYDTYKLSVSNLPAWGGVNATDALVIGRHVSKQDTLQGLKLRAADVDHKFGVNGWDMMRVLEKVVDSSIKWDENWIIDDSAFSIASSTLTRDIKVICLGDVNSSYFGLTNIPSSSVHPVISIDETRAKTGDTVYVSLRGKELLNIGAITLKVKYNPDSLKFIDASGWNSEISQSYFGSSNGIITIAYANVNSRSISNDVLVKLKFICSYSLKRTALNFVKEECEIADSKAIPLDVSYLNGDVITGINSGNAALPSEFKLIQNYPNPFNPVTTISYSIPKESFVELKVYNVLGHVISTLVNKPQAAGEYKIKFDASNLPSGLYIYTLKSGEFRDSKKLMVLK